MARTRRIKVEGDMHYHVMSRTNDRRYLFESGAVRDELADALRRAAASGRAVLSIVEERAVEDDERRAEVVDKGAADGPQDAEDRAEDRDGVDRHRDRDVRLDEADARDRELL